jgi:beta-lactamase superfamily II metal-dependent hydrolase
MEMIVEAEAPPKNVVLRMREHIQREASVHAANIGARPTVVAQRALPLCVIYHLDTFVGDATIIVGLDGTMLIDCGFNWQGVRMAQVAKKLGAHADMLISISHFDKDHFYGVAEVVACYPGAKVISRGATTHMAYAAHLGTCKRVAKPNDWNEIDSDLGRRIKAIYPVECLREDCTRGAHPFDDVKNHKQTALGLGVTIEAKKNFSPQPLSVLRDDNSSSVTWLLRAGTVGYYSAGDLETPDEEQVEIADVHVMKCSHHGAKTTASNAFL